MLESANMLLLSNEATEEDQSLKIQLLLSANSQLREKIRANQVFSQKKERLFQY